jgi:hypothetical protein
MVWCGVVWCCVCVVCVCVWVGGVSEATERNQHELFVELFGFLSKPDGWGFDGLSTTRWSTFGDVQADP